VRRIGAFLTALALMPVAGCATISGTLPAPEPPAGSGAFGAGAAKVDITPPPGFPMGGHSMAGEVSRGYWSRLYARAIYLEDAFGGRIALVSADLWSIPGALADRVAELVGSTAARCGIQREVLILAATHTHQSPGNFSSSPAYNALASPESGFDRALFEFLASRIAEAVTSACEKREPVKIEFAGTQVPLLMRNRSYPAFQLNPESEEYRRENAGLPKGSPSSEYPAAEAFHAVDPSVHFLRIVSESQPSRPLAILSFLSMHPTAMSHDTDVYSGDVFGIAATLAEQRLNARGNGTAIVAFFNGAEGDISPYWMKQGRATALALGTRLAEAVLHANSHIRLNSPQIDFRFARSPLADQCYRQPDGAERCTSARPLIGSATVGGAEDGRTVFHTWGWEEGVTSRFSSDPRQAPKQPAFDPAFLPWPALLSPTRWLASLLPPPEEVPIAVYRLGDLVLATLPGEFTVTMGRRIRDAIAVKFDPRPHAVILIGLANEYVSYFSTPEEYQVQHYEGASTLYGSASGPMILARLASLAGEFRKAHPQVSSVRRYRYAAGTARSFEPAIEMGAITFPQDFLAERAPTSFSKLRTFCWHEPYVSLDVARQKGRWVTPRVAIEQQDKVGRWIPLRIDGVPEDDRGLQFVTVARRTPLDDLEWCSLWLRMDPPALSGNLRFRVDSPDGARFGTPFTQLLRAAE
jgi:neutral ceramidase